MKARKSDIDPTLKTEEIFIDNGDSLPPLFNVDSKEIKEGKKIGEGNWIVHEAEWRGHKVAVKKFVADNTFGNVSLTSREVNRMLSLRHPNVLKLLGFYLTTHKGLVLDCTMIMELMDWDLEKYLEKGPLSDDQVIYIIAEVARGMNHIHMRGCFHRDLKPKNILLRKSIVTRFHVDVKIADFGSSELMGVGNIDPKVGTLGYKAPEQFDSTSKLFPDKVDVFGFGALCFKILTGKKPYESPKNVQEVIKQIDRARISQRNLSKDVVEMIWQCLDVNPKLRPDFGKISHILDYALSKFWEKMVKPLPLLGSTSFQSKEWKSKETQGYDHLERILHKVGLAKEDAVHFIPYEELLVIKAIGAGAYAKIYEVKWKGIDYALKVIDDIGDGSWMGKKYFKTFSKLSHKNIVTFMGYSVTPNEKMCILMELQEMDLDEALGFYRSGGSKSILNIQKRWMIVKEIAEGMKYLHDQGVLHGDLKPGNVVLSALNTNQIIVKLIDFANDVDVFTLQYCAPERLRKESRSTNYVDIRKSDIYSFGLLCQEILFGIKAFEGMSRREVREAKLYGKEPLIPIGTSPEVKCFIQSCWNGDPQERPNFGEVCKRLESLYYQFCQAQNNIEYSRRKCCLL